MSRSVMQLEAFQISGPTTGGDAALPGTSLNMAVPKKTIDWVAGHA